MIYCAQRCGLTNGIIFRLSRFCPDCWLSNPPPRDNSVECITKAHTEYALDILDRFEQYAGQLPESATTHIDPRDMYALTGPLNREDTKWLYEASRKLEHYMLVAFKYPQHFPRPSDEQRMLVMQIRSAIQRAEREEAQLLIDKPYGPLIEHYRIRADDPGHLVSRETRRQVAALAMTTTDIESFEDEDTKMCHICMELLDNSSVESPARLPCGHIHGSACIMQWFAENSLTCPFCRADFKEKIADYVVVQLTRLLPSPWWMTMLRGE
jgi:hypothetical protein